MLPHWLQVSENAREQRAGTGFNCDQEVASVRASELRHCETPTVQKVNKSEVCRSKLAEKLSTKIMNFALFVGREGRVVCLTTGAVPQDETLRAPLLQHHVIGSLRWGEDVRRQWRAQATRGAQVQLTYLKDKEERAETFDHHLMSPGCTQAHRSLAPRERRSGFSKRAKYKKHTKISTKPIGIFESHCH